MLYKIFKIIQRSFNFLVVADVDRCFAETAIKLW